MGTHPATLGQLVNRLLADTEFARLACITSLTTGNPALAEIDLRLPRQLIALQYDTLEDLDQVVSNHAGQIDLAVVDPFHTYDSSTACLDRCLRLLRSGGLLVVHDCVPPPEMISPEPLEREWSGVTFAAFRDVMIQRQLPWCTLDTDYGIGIAVAVGFETTAEQDTTTTPWSVAAHDAYVADYLADPCRFMRTVRTSAWNEAVNRLRTGGNLADLTATFTGWHTLIPLGAPGSTPQQPSPAPAGAARAQRAPLRAARRALRTLRRAVGRR